MTRALVVLNDKADRDKVARWAHGVPDGTRVEFKPPKRSLPQNDRMWAMLTDIAAHMKKAHAKNFTTDQWKAIFMHACGREVSFLPSLDGHTFIPWGQSSSDLGVKEMTDLIEFMFAWGAEKGVIFNEPQDNTNSATADLQSPVDQSPDNDEGRTSSEDGGDGNPRTGSSPSSTISDEDRRALIECCFKLMFIPIDPDLQRQESKRGVLETSKNAWKLKLDEHLHPHLKSFFQSADAVIKGEADRDKAISEFAYVLECTPEELGAAP